MERSTPLPKAQVLTLDHPFSHLHRVAVLLGPVRAAFTSALAVAAGLWPLMAALGLMFFLALTATFG